MSLVTQLTRRRLSGLCRTMPQVMVLSSEGYFYSYNIDLENGGECSLMKQYRYVALVVFSGMS